jgi:predicted ATPase
MAGPEVIARAASGQAGWCAPEIFRAQGIGVLRRGDAGSMVEAETIFLRALTLAREQSARSWELRTATSLARLYQKTGRSGDARQILAPVYDDFSEGFGTVDMTGAAVLLNNL